jgi:uncharacterized protein YjbJ (UPF0337 family)
MAAPGPSPFSINPPHGMENDTSTAPPSAASAKEGAQGLIDQAKETAGDLAGQAKEKAGDAFSQQREKATGALGDVADALHATSDRLRENDQDFFAQYADAAAEQVERFTGAVRDLSVGDLLDEAERFARREPGLFIGGAFLLGVFGARFVKASQPSRAGRSGGARSFSGAPGGSGGSFSGGGRPQAGGGAARRPEDLNPASRVLHTAGGEMPNPPGSGPTTVSGSTSGSGNASGSGSSFGSGGAPGSGSPSPTSR